MALLKRLGHVKNAKVRLDADSVSSPAEIGSCRAFLPPATKSLLCLPSRLEGTRLRLEITSPV